MISITDEYGELTKDAQLTMTAIAYIALDLQFSGRENDPVELIRGKRAIVNAACMLVGYGKYTQEEIEANVDEVAAAICNLRNELIEYLKLRKPEDVK